MSSPFDFPDWVYFVFVCRYTPLRALFVALSEELLGLPFGVRGQDGDDVLESSADLNSESVRVLEDTNETSASRSWDAIWE